MKKKILALILTVLMLVPAVSVISSANVNYGTSSYLDNVSYQGGSQTSSIYGNLFGTSGVNAGVPAIQWASAGDAIAYGVKDSGIYAFDSCSYWAAQQSTLDAGTIKSFYGAMQTIAPATEIVAKYKSALNGAKFTIGTFTNMQLNTACTASGIGPTTISFVYSTDPVPALSRNNYGANTGYIVNTTVGGASGGLINNGIVVTLTSNGVFGNGEIAGFKCTKATNYHVALYENGNVLAYKTGAVSSNLYLYEQKEVEAFGGASFTNNVSFDGSTLSFSMEDGFGQGTEVITLNSTDSGWSDIARLSEFKDYYCGIMVTSPVTIRNAGGNTDYGCANMVLSSYNGSAPSACAVNDVTVADTAFYKNIISSDTIGWNTSGAAFSVNESASAIRARYQAKYSVLSDNSVHTVTFLGGKTHSYQYTTFGLSVRRNGSQAEINTDGTAATANTRVVPIFVNGNLVGNIGSVSDGVVYYRIYLYNIPSTRYGSYYSFNQYVIFNIDGTAYVDRMKGRSRIKYNTLIGA